MNIFQIECLVYLLTLVLLICVAIKDIREVIYDITDMFIITPLRKGYMLCCTKPDPISNPIERQINNIEIPLIKYSYEQL